ncbi:glycosyltransferase [Candidatus Aerophobetes bacterium]|nr:glycosyltransferase [Candidatus Aerophobetes bacterium]
MNKSDKDNKNIEVSVIIPTYNRAYIIEKVVKNLANQTYPPDKYEVIIVDDGSTDNTQEVVSSISAPCDLRYFKQENKGASCARNYGIKKARGEIVIFVDSDILVTPSFIKEHLSCHKEDGVIVRGAIINTDNIDNPFGEKMKLGDLSFAFFATGNVSIRKKYLFKVGLFDEDFKEYGWEDLELGLRLKREGLKVITNKNAIGYHYRKKATLADLPALCAKERMRGRMAVLFYRKHPTLEVKLMTHISSFFFILDRFLNPVDWRNTRWIGDLLLRLEKRNSHFLLGLLIKIITSHCYISGVREALKGEEDFFRRKEG